MHPVTVMFVSMPSALAVCKKAAKRLSLKGQLAARKVFTIVCLLEGSVGLIKIWFLSPALPSRLELAAYHVYLSPSFCFWYVAVLVSIRRSPFLCD